MISLHGVSLRLGGGSRAAAVQFSLSRFEVAEGEAIALTELLRQAGEAEAQQRQAALLDELLTDEKAGAGQGAPPQPQSAAMRRKSEKKRRQAARRRCAI